MILRKRLPCLRKRLAVPKAVRDTGCVTDIYCPPIAAGALAGEGVHSGCEAGAPEGVMGHSAQSPVFREGFKHHCTAKSGLKAEADLVPCMWVL